MLGCDGFYIFESLFGPFYFDSHLAIRFFASS